MKKILLSGLCIALCAMGCTRMHIGGRNLSVRPTPGTSMQTYAVHRAAAAPALEGHWNGPIWREADTSTVDNFFTLDSGHYPATRVRMLYDEKGVYVHFRVRDRYVRSIETEYHGKVWEDSCVEAYLKPKADRGYFNFEINCGGTLLVSYHENKEWQGESLREGGHVPWDLAKAVRIYHSMPAVVDPEIKKEVIWKVEFFIPYALFEAYLGPLGNPSGQEWTGQFYKNAEAGAHTHGASWSPILKGEKYHDTTYFGVLKFEE